MAHPYTARSHIEAKIGAELMTALCDRNNDEVEDPGVLDSAIESACAVLDSMLRQQYVVPFQAYNATTPGWYCVCLGAVDCGALFGCRRRRLRQRCGADFAKTNRHVVGHVDRFADLVTHAANRDRTDDEDDHDALEMR
jgi:Protein of unknown function (DUF1320)